MRIAAGFPWGGVSTFSAALRIAALRAARCYDGRSKTRHCEPSDSVSARDILGAV